MQNQNIPSEVEQVQSHGTEHSGRYDPENQETALIVPVLQEDLIVEKRRVETGRTRITKHVHEHEEVIDEPVLREDVAIEHVPINKIWEGPAPAPRYEGDTLVIPLLEEVLVVEKRLMLKEELRISRIQKTVREPQTVVWRSEEVTVDRVEPPSETQKSDTSSS
jgi:uncharacterized protein (TIGR02271 family)